MNIKEQYKNHTEAIKILKDIIQLRKDTIRLHQEIIIRLEEIWLEDHKCHCELVGEECCHGGLVDNN